MTRKQRHRYFLKVGRLIQYEPGRICLIVCCHWCQVWLPWKLGTVDHVVPRGLGGWAMDYSNLVPACFDCNSRRNHDWQTSEDGQAFQRQQQQDRAYRARLKDSYRAANPLRFPVDISGARREYLLNLIRYRLKGGELLPWEDAMLKETLHEPQ